MKRESEDISVFTLNSRAQCERRIKTSIRQQAKDAIRSRVGFRPAPASELLQRNLLIYGLGGLVAPFIGIKAIDLIVAALHLA